MNNFLIDAAVLGVTALPGCTGAGAEKGVQSHEPMTNSNMYHRLRSVARHAGSISLTTTGLKAILDLMSQGTNPILPYPCLDLFGVANGLSVWALAQDDVMPVFKTGAVHEKLSILRGQLAMTKLSWAGVGTPIVSQLRCTPLSADGTASYWSPTAAVAPAAPPLEGDYEVTSVLYNSVAIPELASLEIDFNAPISARYNVGKTYPQGLNSAPAGGLVEINARIQVPDRTLLRSWGQTYQGPASLQIVCTNYAQAAARGASTVTFTLRSTAEVVNVSDDRPSTSELLFAGIKDTTDASAMFTWVTA